MNILETILESVLIIAILVLYTLTITITLIRVYEKYPWLIYLAVIILTIILIVKY